MSSPQTSGWRPLRVCSSPAWQRDWQLVGTIVSSCTSRPAHCFIPILASSCPSATTPKAGSTLSLVPPHGEPLPVRLPMLFQPLVIVQARLQANGYFADSLTDCFRSRSLSRSDMCSSSDANYSLPILVPRNQYLEGIKKKTRVLPLLPSS